MKKVKYIKARLTELNERISYLELYLNCDFSEEVLISQNAAKAKIKRLKHRISILKVLLKDVRKNYVKQAKMIIANGYEVLNRYPFNKIAEGETDWAHQVKGFGSVKIPKSEGVFTVVHSAEVVKSFIDNFISENGKEPIFKIIPKEKVWFKKIQVV